MRSLKNKIYQLSSIQLIHNTIVSCKLTCGERLYFSGITMTADTPEPTKKKQISVESLTTSHPFSIMTVECYTHKLL